MTRRFLHPSRLLLATLALAACQSRPLTGVRVLAAPNGRSTCVRVYFERRPGDVVASDPLAIAPGDPVLIGVAPAQADALLEPFAWAVGFADPSCAEATEPKEVSARLPLVFEQTLTLQLAVQGSQVDSDGGGFVDGGVADAGGLDAGGFDAGGFDAGGVDAGRDAGAPDAGGPDGGPPDGGVDGGPTTCPATADCSLAACSGLPCDDGLTCGSGKTCGNGRCLAATCTRLGTTCGMSCAQGGQCVSVPAPAALDYACDDGNQCTLMDRCDGDGGCQGAERACADRQPRGPCYLGDVCVAADGSCAPRFTDAGTPCDDGNGCTVADTCDGVGVCRPGGACPSTECRIGVCTFGTCGQALAVEGTPCTGGFCGDAGTCVALAVVPSNLPPQLAQLPGAPNWSPSNLGSCVAVVSTGSLADGLDAGSVRVRTTNCFALTLPPAVVTRQADDAGVPVVVFPLRDFTLGSNVHLRFVGDRPVAFLASGDITLNGTLDFSAMDDSSEPAANVSGAGGNLDGFCAVGRGAPGQAVTNGRATGAGGGGFGSIGAVGGGADMLSGGAGGPAGGNAELIPLRGGCGSSAFGGFNGFPGRAGGAVQLVAQGRVTVRGTLAANGHGGFGGRISARGGGGGGSGGAILIEADELVVEGLARVIAHGGGGGSGADFNSLGIDGSDPPNLGFAAAAGGTCLCVGGGGGAGNGPRSILPMPGGAGAGMTGGGGGGGGGFGRIRVNARSCDVQGVPPRISPDPTTGRASCE